MATRSTEKRIAHGEALPQTAASAVKPMHRAAALLREAIADAQAVLQELRDAEQMVAEHAQLAVPLHAPAVAPRTMGRVCSLVATEFGISLECFHSAHRCRPLPLARAMAAFLLHDAFDSPYMAIGRYFGKHHSTVLLAVRGLRSEMEHNEGLRERVLRIRAALQERVQ